MSYDSGGRMTGQTENIGGSGTAILTSITYDHADRILTIVHNKGVPSGGSGYTTTTLASYTYAYDSGGGVTTQTNNDGTFTYTYDHADELTAVGDATSESYSYDSNGNRTMTGYTTGSDNELSNDGTYTYTYDAEGNMTGKSDAAGDTWTYSYDYHNQMTGFTEKNSGGTTIAQGTYVYDVLDRRIETAETVSGTSTTTWTVFNGSSNMPFMDFNGSGTLQERYLSGPAYIAGLDSLLARTSSGGTTAWYLDDMLGSVRDIANSSGTVIDHIKYDAFGDVTNESSPTNGDRFKFDGMAWDAALGSYYDNARYYNPTDAAFATQDPSGFGAGETDLYEFTSNSPINLVDVTGLATQGSEDPPAPGVDIQKYMTDFNDSLQEAVFKAGVRESENQRIEYVKKAFDDAMKLMTQLRKGSNRSGPAGDYTAYKNKLLATTAKLNRQQTLQRVYILLVYMAEQQGITRDPANDDLFQAMSKMASKLSSQYYNAAIKNRTQQKQEWQAALNAQSDFESNWLLYGSFYSITDQQRKEYQGLRANAAQQFKEYFFAAQEAYVLSLGMNKKPGFTIPKTPKPSKPLPGF